MVSKYVSM